ncbi:uncharacterized protein [Elaeis guineensis]|uniref:Zinc finger CCCH domain-containing protein 19 isoform X2 n=1 Tax=Elaeis guineensis var. tenera TaxID=51953 RepID=A0A6J0PP37_ELAGV|nr:zinc finger CCCH domain-containing protein 19 isoform X2 [Elaeis guineensis]
MDREEDVPPPIPPSPTSESEETSFPQWEEGVEAKAAAVGATEADDLQLFASPSSRPSTLSGDEEEAAAFEPVAPGDAAAGEAALQMGVEVVDPATEAASRASGKRKRGRPPKGQGGRRAPPAKRKEEEDVCFICFDGGNLVVCDRRGCSKVYHPACVNRDDAFFHTRGRWNCGWHICSICEKAAHYMCYTCTYSLCKGCIREAKFFAVRGNKGFCDTCYSTVMLIESNENGNENKAGVDFNDMNSWEYLFKKYWLDQKRKLVLTLEELKNAKNPWKGSRFSAHSEESSDELYNANDDQEYSSESSSGHHEGSTSSRRKVRRRSRNTVDDESSAKEVDSERTSMPEDAEWASQELLEFVAHMKNGDKSVQSQFDVQALLLEYIKRNNLRDPRKKSQIVCDLRLQNLFGKPRVGHFEMLKLLESHFLIKEASQIDADDDEAVVMDPDTGQVDAEGYSDTTAKMRLDKKRKSRKKIEEREPQTNLDDYAAIDVHNINLIYLRRNLMEDLIDDIDMFNEKVVGSFVRIKIPGTGQRQDMYRLVQVVGTQMFAEKYKIGKKTTDIALQILNLDKTEVVTIDVISNQEFTEECKRLRQSVKCGLISRLTVGDVQNKARVLQAVKVDAWLESEKLRLSHLRDRASETGRRKELRECVERLQLLSTPEERMRRLNEVPEIHADPHMDPDYESAEEEEADDKRDKYGRSRESLSRRKGRDFFSIGRGSGSNFNWNGASKSSSGSRVLSRGSLTEDAQDKLEAPSGGGDRENELSWNQVKDAQWTSSSGAPNSQASATGQEAGIWNNNQLVTKPGNTYGIAPETTSASVPSRLSVPLNINENDKVWHYQDPAGTVQGPFSMIQLRKWSKFFPPDLRIWLTTDRQENYILLTDAMKSQNGLPQQEPQHNSYPQPTNFAGAMDNRDNRYGGGLRGTDNSTWVGMQNGSNWNASQNGATFSTAVNILASAGRWVPLSANLSVPKMEVVKGNNASYGQPHGQSSPRPTTPFWNPYQQPCYQGGGDQGNAGRGNGVQDHGSAWNSDRPGESRTIGQGYDRQHSNWSYLNQQSQQTFAEPWKARPVNDSNLLPAPTPQPSRRDWTRVQGSLHTSASTADSIQPISSGWSTTQTTGFTGAHHLPTANPNGGWDVPKQSEDQGSWSVTSASVPSISRMADVGTSWIPERVDHLGDPQLPGQQKPSEANAPNILVNQSGPFPQKGETSYSNNAAVPRVSAMNKNQSFESDYPSPTPRCHRHEFSVPNDPDPAKKWPQAHDSSASKSQVSDPAVASLAFEPSDPGSQPSPEVDNMQLLSRYSDDVADKSIITEMQNVATQKPFSEKQNKQPSLAGVERKLVDPVSNIKLTTEFDVLELSSDQGSEASSAPKPVSELHGWPPGPAQKQEPNGSSTVPAPPRQDLRFSGTEPINYSNLEGPQDMMGSEWSLPSPTPASRSSGWDIDADSTSGWGTLGQVSPNANSDRETPAKGDVNANLGWEASTMANVKGPGMGAANPGNSNPHTVWGATAEGNPNQYSGWGAPSTGNASQNLGWGAQTQQGNTDASAGWGTGSNRSWNLPAGDPDGWGSQRKHHGDKYPRGRESGHGGGRISWDGSGEASRPIPRGLGQRGVCKFHESGHCKKGASCNYLHP